MRRTLLVVILVASIGALAGSTASTRPALAASCDPIQTPPVFQGQAPTAQTVLGFGLGSQEVTAAEADRYVQAVDAASTRVVSGVLATSWEGRPLRYALVGTPEHVTPAGLAAIRAATATPARPRDAARRGRRARRGHPGDPLADGQRPRRRGERHGRRASRPLRARRPHRLRRDADPRQRARRDHPDAEPGRPRGRAAAERLLLRHEPRLVRAGRSPRPRGSSSSCGSTRASCTSTPTRWAGTTSSSRRPRTRSTTR